jgi:PAS domain S-box-containing protein
LDWGIWNQLFEQAPEAAAVLGTDDSMLRVNKEFTRMFGYEAGEVLGRLSNHLIVPEALVKSAQELSKQLEHGGRVEVETVRKRKNGSEVYVSLLAVRVTTSSSEQVVDYVLYRDITERRLAEERLRESGARFQAMADTAPVLIWMTGTDGLCNYLNPDDVQGCFDCFPSCFPCPTAFPNEVSPPATGWRIPLGDRERHSEIHGDGVESRCDAVL